MCSGSILSFLGVFPPGAKIFFLTQKRFKEFIVFKDQPDNRRKEKTTCPNIEDRKRDLESRVN